MEIQNNKKSIIIFAVVLAIIVVVLGFASSRNKPESETPQPEVSQEERGAIVSEAVAKAKPATSIDISACKPFPEVAEFQIGTQVEFKNGDGVPHTVSFSPKNTFTIPAKGKLKIVFDFWEFPGVRNYSCDSAPAGKVVVTK